MEVDAAKSGCDKYWEGAGKETKGNFGKSAGKSKDGEAGKSFGKGCKFTNGKSTGARTAEERKRLPILLHKESVGIVVVGATKRLSVGAVRLDR